MTTDKNKSTKEDVTPKADVTDEVQTKLHPRKKIYILPNLFTLAALFGGFYAIVMSMNGDFKKAAIGIFCAMILDGLDGRIARLTRTESEFGEQFDSLSDMVSFGAAPALVIYMWGLKDLGKLGWLVAFIYCACGAMRLARFNTNIGIVDKRYFQGLPSPAAAAIVASFVWTMVDIDASRYSVLALIFTLFAGLSMVSNIPFRSFKGINFRESASFFKVVFYGVLPFTFLLGLFVYKPAQTLLIIFLGYGVIGYALYFYNRLKGNKITTIVSPDDDA